MPNRFFEPAIHEFDLSKNEFDLTHVFRQFCTLDKAVFLDGCGDRHPVAGLNRFSFLAADPINMIEVSPGQTFDLQRLASVLECHSSNLIKDLPPFQGGLAGFIGYEFCQQIESIPTARINDFSTPLISLGVYDVVLAIDHHKQRAWLISQGWPEKNLPRRKKRAETRIKSFKNLILAPTREAEFRISDWIEPQSRMNRIESFGGLELYSDFSKGEFLDSVAQAVKLIRAGDIFQVNLSQRLLSPMTKTSPDLYLDMRAINPAPFSGYFDFGTGQIISASPERLVSMQDSWIESRPIKGTRKRTRYPEVDLNTRLELLSSAKDRAENTMIVDLMRNDLSRVSTIDSVVVHKLCGIEDFQNVMHLVSVVRSKLASNCGPVDILKNVFPGGSITGAPKIRAMEIITELEPTARGPYCGSLGYLGFDGNLDFNILIRTVTAQQGWWQIPVGGGIVSDSVPELEYDETFAKAIGMLNAIYQNPKSVRNVLPLPIGNVV